MNKRLRPILVLGVVSLVLAACGSSSGSKSSDTTKPKSTSTTAAKAKQTITVTPNSNLTNAQVVTVVGKGFTPGAQNIGANECADKGDQTGAGDCDLAGTKTAIPDSSGTVTFQFTVNKGPFGANNIVCSATQKCLVSIAELTASPTQEADTTLNFAP